VPRHLLCKLLALKVDCHQHNKSAWSHHHEGSNYHPNLGSQCARYKLHLMVL